MGKNGSKSKNSSMQGLTAASAPTVFTENCILPSARKVHNDSPDALNNTQELAQALAQLSHNKESVAYRDLYFLAEGVLSNFAKEKAKTKSLITEVVALAAADNQALTHEVLNQCATALVTDNYLLSQELLEGLGNALRLTGNVRQDDLMRLLGAMVELVNRVHAQLKDQRNAEVHQSLLTALASLLDAMTDIGMQGVDRINLHEPLYDALAKYLKLPGPLSYQAHYCRQALVRLPNDENKWKQYLRRTIQVSKGINALCDAVNNMTPGSLIDAYLHFGEAVKGIQESKQAWYDELRYAQLLLTAGQFVAFEQFIKTTDSRLEQGFVYGVMQSLDVCVTTHPNAHVRLEAMHLLSQFFNYYTQWYSAKGLFERIKNKALNTLLWVKPTNFLHEVIHYFVKYSRYPDDAIRVSALQLLNEWPQKADAVQLGVLESEAVRAGRTAALLEMSDSILSSPQLLKKARLTHGPSVTSKLLKHREEVINYYIGGEQDEMLTRDLNLYVPARVSNTDYDHKTIELEEAVQSFVDNNAEKVLLLLGSSGAGKSLFGRYFERRFWLATDNIQPAEAYIPIFIALKGVADPTHDLIIPTFRKLGFTANQIDELKKKYRFLFILDGYDEIQSKENLYNTNHLEEWKAKIIINCRLEYLRDKTESHKARFALTKSGDRIVDASLREYYMRPFSSEQIDHYLARYVALSPVPWPQAEQYRQYIDLIPGLRELITSPFLLRISAEVLPNIVAAHENKEEFAVLTRGELYKVFTAEWFKRQQSKKTSLEQDDLIDFARRLAAKMYLKGVTAVHYNTQDAETKKEWEDFFSDKTPEITSYRLAMPLRKEFTQETSDVVGHYTYSFLHKSLLEFFYSAQIFNQDSRFVVALPVKKAVRPSTHQKSIKPKQDVISSDMLAKGDETSILHQLNQKLFNHEPSIVGFLADTVRGNVVLQTNLFEVIERSKQDNSIAVAAANAMTILNVAGVQFSHKDFSSVHIAGADLGGAMLEEVNFQQADLTGVNFRNAFLKKASLKGAKMEGVQFGERAYLALEDATNALAFSTDGKSLALGSWLGQVTLWDLESNACIQTLATRHTTCVSFSSDNTHLATGSKEKEICLWHVQSAQLEKQFLGHTGAVWSVNCSRDGYLLASGGEHKEVMLWEIATGKYSALVGHLDDVFQVNFSPDGKQLVSAGGHLVKGKAGDNSVRIWDVATKQCLHLLKGHTHYVTHAIFSADGKFVITASADNTVRVWDGQTAACVHTVSIQSGVRSLQFLPNGQWFATGNGNGSVQFWDVSNGQCVKILQAHSQSIIALTFSADGNTLATSSEDRTVHFWDLTVAQNLKQESNHHAGRILDVHLSADGKWLVTASEDYTARLWDVKTGECTKVLVGHQDTINCVKFSPNSQLIATGSDDHTARLWDVTTGQCTQTFTAEGVTSFTHIGFSPDGLKLSTASQDNVARVWDIATARCEKAQVISSGSLWSVGFLPQGEWLAATQDNFYRGILPLAKVAQSQCLTLLEGQSQIKCVSFSPNKRWLVTGGSDKTAVLWDSEGTSVHRLTGHSAEILSISFSADSNSFVTGSADHTVRYWKIIEVDAKVAVHLVWASHLTLFVEQLDLADAISLSNGNAALLKQQGAYVTAKPNAVAPALSQNFAKQDGAWLFYELLSYCLTIHHYDEVLNYAEKITRLFKQDNSIYWKHKEFDLLQVLGVFLKERCIAPAENEWRKIQAKRCLVIVEDLFALNPESKQLDFLLDLATLFAEKKYYAIAQLYVQSVETRYEQIAAPSSFLIKFHPLLAQCHQELSQQSEAENHYQRALSLLELQEEKDELNLIKVKTRLMWLYDDRGEKAIAQQLGQEILALQETVRARMQDLEPVRRAELLLARLAKNLGLNDIAFDENNTCILGVDNNFSLHLTYEFHLQRLYLYSPLLDGFPKEAYKKLALYQMLLAGNMLGGKMLGGGSGIDLKSELIVAHCVLELKTVEHEFALEEFLPAYVSLIEYWRRQCQRIIGGQIQEPENFPEQIDFFDATSLLKKLNADRSLEYQSRDLLPSEKMRQIAELQLQEFAQELKLVLEFDENNTCILAIDDQFSLHITYDPGKHLIYLYSPLLDGFPRDLAEKLSLFEMLLEGSMLGGKIMGGGVGIAEDEELILLHTTLTLFSQGLSTNIIGKFAAFYVDKVKEWREKCAQFVTVDSTVSKKSMGNLMQTLRKKAKEVDSTTMDQANKKLISLIAQDGNPELEKIKRKLDQIKANQAKVSQANLPLHFMQAIHWSRIEETTDYAETIKTRQALVKKYNEEGEAYCDANQYPLTMRCVQQALLLDSLSLKAIENGARTYLNVGNYEMAFEHLQHYLLLVPTSAWAMMLLAECLNQKGDAVAALIYCEKSLVASPNYAWAHHRKGKILSSQYRYEEALLSFNQALINAPDDITLLREKSECLSQLGRNDEAETLIKPLLNKDKRNVDLLASMRYFAQEKGDHHQALKYCDEILAVKPGLIWAQRQKANLLKAIGRYQEAYQIYVDALTLPFEQDLLDVTCDLIALLTEQFGRYQEAWFYFEQAENFPLTEKEKSNSLLTARRAVLFAYQGDSERAWQEIKTKVANALNTQDKRTHLCFQAYIYCVTRQYSQAVEITHQVLVLNKFDAWAKPFQAWIYALMNAPNALTAANEVLLTKPMNDTALAAKSLAYVNQSDYSAAQTTLKQGLKINPQSLELLLIQARLYGAQGKKADAAVYLNHIFSINPNEPLALAYKAELEQSNQPLASAASTGFFGKKSKRVELKKQVTLITENHGYSSFRLAVTMLNQCLGDFKGAEKKSARITEIARLESELNEMADDFNGTVESVIKFIQEVQLELRQPKSIFKGTKLGVKLQHVLEEIERLEINGIRPH